MFSRSKRFGGRHGVPLAPPVPPAGPFGTASDPVVSMP